MRVYCDDETLSCSATVRMGKRHAERLRPTSEEVLTGRHVGCDADARSWLSPLARHSAGCAHRCCPHTGPTLG